MMSDHPKCGTQLLPTHHSTRITNNGDPQFQADINGPKQSPNRLIGKRKSRIPEPERSPVQRSGLGKNSGELCKELGDGIKKSPTQMKKTRSLSSQMGNRHSSVRNEIQLRKAKSDTGKALGDRKCKDSVGDFKDSLSLQIVKAETAVTDEAFDDKNVVNESIKDAGDPINMSNGEEGEEEEEEEVDREINVDVERKVLEATDMVLEERKPEKAAIKEKKLIPVDRRSAPPAVKKQAVNHARVHPSSPVSDNSDATPSKLQSFADLVMWRDVSRSAFVFGIGAFAIISSSYTTDLNISFISVVSYLGLVYLGISFTLTSFVSRGISDIKQEYVIGEEEAIWLIQLILPYVNEFLLKLRSLFSGDPATTMKLAVILFVSARCGGSMTIWKMAKLGFLGAFIVPKLCSSYSPNLGAYGTFWMRRFGDAWESCSNKKAVGLGIFTLVWNLSSIVARIWALFLLFVAFKYYQSLQQEAVPADSVPESSGTQTEK